MLLSLGGCCCVLVQFIPELEAGGSGVEELLQQALAANVPAIIRVCRLTILYMWSSLVLLTQSVSTELSSPCQHEHHHICCRCHTPRSSTGHGLFSLIGIILIHTCRASLRDRSSTSRCSRNFRIVPF